MVFVVIIAAVLVAAVVQELVLDRIRLRRGRRTMRPRDPQPFVDASESR